MDIYKETKSGRPVFFNLVERGGGILLAGVYLYGGIPKLYDIGSFAEVVGAYGIVPDSLVFITAAVLPVLEVITGIGLLLNRKWAKISALLLLLLFISVLSYGIYLGLDIDCGCFGAEDPEHEAFSGLRSALIRDLVFLIPACYLLIMHNIKAKQLSERRMV